MPQHEAPDPEPIRPGGAVEPRDTTAPDTTDPPGASVARVLLVDDNPADLLSLQGILEPLGQTLMTAGSGDDALRCVLNAEFAVIVMDLRMPGLDGLETASLIRARERSAHVPIIFLTAATIADTEILRAYERGAVDFLLKPFSPDILCSKVKVFVDLYLKERVIRRQAVQLRVREREAFQRRSEIRFRSLLDSVPLCVIATRSNGMVYYLNETAAAYLGQPVGDVPDSPLLEIVCPEDRARVESSWDDARRRQQPLEMQFRMKRASDGAYRWHLLRAVPQSDDDGNLSSWVCTATDIDAYHEARAEAELANRMKDDFLAIVSHELRNPLSSILAWSRLLRSGSLDPAKAARGLEIIERNAQSQTAMVDEILDISRIVKGKLNLTFASLDMPQVVEAALTAARPLAEAKEITLDSELDAGLPLEVSGDALRLQQVVWNLLSNAIKFTPRAGRVQVRLRADQSHLELTITDTGKGISREFLPYIFDRFRQEDPGSTRLYSGLGLGLSISRQIVEMHHGTIRAESEGADRGATFTVRLPLMSYLAEAALQESATPGRLPLLLDGLKTLVVDDELEIREAMVELLGEYGAQVIAAASVREALAAIRESQPDVLISDIRMPFEDGYDLIRSVRALGPGDTVHLPAIALTGWGTDEESSHALGAGFQVYMRKPIEPQKLVGAIHELAKGRGDPNGSLP